jgi:hypothetical protein
MRVLEYKQINKGALVGSMSMQFEEWGGLIIRDITLFQKDGKRWLSFPSRAYEKDGKTEYFQYVRFEDKIKHEAWQQKALKALQDFANEPKATTHSQPQSQAVHGQLKGTGFIPPSQNNLTPAGFGMSVNGEELPF